MVISIVQNVRLPPLNALRTFVVAARVGSFNKAAEELCVTPAAVSRSIRSLESYLGCPLFYRTHRQISLSKEGQYYLSHLGSVFDQISLATQNLIAHRAKRPLTVCAYPSLIINWLIPRWARFARESPAFELKLVTTHTHDVDFERASIDAAILSDRADYGKCVCEPLFVARLVPVCSPNYLPPGTRAIDADEWGSSLLHSETRPHDWHRWAVANKIANFDPYRGLRFESSKLMYEAAISGIGIAIGIQEVLERELSSGALKIPFDDNVAAPCAFYLIRPASTEAHPYFPAFREWLFGEVAKERVSKMESTGLGLEEPSRTQSLNFLRR